MTPEESARLDELAEIGQDPTKRAQYPYFEPYTHGNIQGSKATFPSEESAKAYLKGKLVRKLGELTWFIPRTTRNAGVAESSPEHSH